MADTGRLILALNPGGTSTKLGLFRETELVFEKNIRHMPDELAEFDSTFDQHDFRRKIILPILEEAGYSQADLASYYGLQVSPSVACSSQGLNEDLSSKLILSVSGIECS